MNIIILILVLVHKANSKDIATIISQEIAENIDHPVKCTFLVKASWPQFYDLSEPSGPIIRASNITNVTLPGSACLISLHRPSSKADYHEFIDQIKLTYKEDHISIVMVNNLSQLNQLDVCETKSNVEAAFYDTQLNKIDDSKRFCLRSLVQAALFVFPPFVYPNSEGEFIGKDIELLNNIAGKMGLDVELNKTRQTVTLVAQNKFDIGVSGLDFTWPRFQTVDYSCAISHMAYTFKSGLPKEVASFKTLIDPFDGWIWLFLLLSCILVNMFLVAQNKTMSKFNDESSFYELALIAFAIPINVSLSLQLIKKSGSKNNLCLFWFLTATMLGFAYKSNLLSILTIKRFEKPIDSPQDVLDNNLIMYIPRQAPLTRKYFINALSPIMKQVYQKSSVEREGLYDFTGFAYPEHTENIIGGKASSIGIDMMQIANGHTYQYSKNFWAFEHVGHIFPKGHWLQKPYTHYTGWLLATGVYERNHAKHVIAGYRGRAFDKRQQKTNLTKLRLSQISNVFIVMAIGTFLGVFAFILELRVIIMVQVKNALRKARVRAGKLMGSGKKMIKSLKKQDAELQKSESGLQNKIVQHKPDIGITELELHEPTD